MKLSDIIQIHQGHTFPVAPDPDWSGSIEDFWKANEDMTWGDIASLRRDLVDFGYHRIGGGAQGCFTVMTPHAAAVNAVRA